MFDQIEENEILKSIACQRDGKVLGMRRFADLVAEEFIDKIETVLCPGTLIIQMFRLGLLEQEWSGQASGPRGLQSSRFLFCPTWQKPLPPRNVIPGEWDVYLVGEKTRLVCGP